MKRSAIRGRRFLFAVLLLFLSLTPGYAQNATSEARVEFTAGQGPTYPVDPEDPDTPGNGLGTTGSLAIVSVSTFDFGEIPIVTATELFGITTFQPNIQIVDLRGTGAGWRVLASVSRFSSNGEETLPGAAIHIISGRPNSASAPPGPTQTANTVLTTDGSPVPVLSAASGAGMGQWVMRWYPPADEGVYVKLEMPAGAATIGSHTATINWVLEDVPS